MASISKRANGSWLARWRETPGGPQKTKVFSRKVDGERFLVGVSHSLLVGSYVDPTDRTTVAAYYEVWSARQPWRASTRNAVVSVFANHVVPTFGNRPLASIRRGEVEAWAAGLSLAPRTANVACQYLSSMFASALADGLAAVNPCHGAKRPRVDAVPVVPYTAAQLARLHEASPGYFDVAVTLGSQCGLRQSEASGLTVDRLDFLRRELKVDRQLSLDSKSFAPLKTATSYRTIPLADVTLTALAGHLERYGAGTDGLVLHGDQGEAIAKSRFGHLWVKLRTEAGLGAEARFHDCRHTFASILLSQGVGVPAVAEYLGHTPAVLLATYSHLVPQDHNRARSAVQAAFQATEDSLSTADRATGQ